MMESVRILDLKNSTIDESDNDLDPTWLIYSYEQRLALHSQILLRGMALEEAVKGVVIPRHMDKTVHYDVLRDAF
jgi:hypothetical protein